MSLWQELGRRSVYKVGAAYLAAAWLIVQVVSTVDEPLGLPQSFDTGVVVLLAIGLPIALIIAWAFELTPDGIRRTDVVQDHAPARARVGGHRLNYFITAVLVLAVGFLLVDRFVPGAAPDAGRRTGAGDVVASGSRSLAEAGDGVANPAAAPSLDDRIRLAVLPLRSLSTDPELALFAVGLSEQLIRELKQIPELLVTDRGSSFAFKDSSLGYREIADQLGVANVLDGTIASDADTLRISVALVRVDDDAQLWQSTRDFERSEIFAVQDEITEQVATALSVTLGVLASRKDGMTRNVEAYTAYLTGIGYAQSFTEASLGSAIRLQQRAIALDPQFIAPRIALYFAYNNLAALSPEAEAAALQQSADETLELLRTLAPNERMVGVIDTIRNLGDGNWSEVESFLRTERSVGLPGAEEWGFNMTLGAFLHRVGRVREGLAYLETARALAPNERTIAFNLAAAYAAAGNLDAALAEVERGREGPEDSALLAGEVLLIALASRDRAKLEAALADNESSLSMWRDLGALLDDRDAAIGEIRRRIDQGVEETPLAVGLLAHWASYFGEPALALEIMRSLPSDTAFLQLMLWEPGMADARKLPEFNALVAELGLVDYWREYGWPDFCRPAGDDFECE